VAVEPTTKTTTATTKFNDGYESLLLLYDNHRDRRAITELLPFITVYSICCDQPNCVKTSRCDALMTFFEYRDKHVDEELSASAPA